MELVEGIYKGNKVADYFNEVLSDSVIAILEQILNEDPKAKVRLLEIGAGTGIMAADMLLELERLGSLPENYRILELSPDLQQRQRQIIEQNAPHLVNRVCWVNRLPGPGFRGVVVANELLDAMPVHRFRHGGTGVEEQYVTWTNDTFQYIWRETENQLLLLALDEIGKRVGLFAADYQSEINLRLAPWLSALGKSVEQAALILIDYGYTEKEYYHPERSQGTLICHFRHRAHDDPLQLVGLQDITANVDFSAVARAGIAAGFKLAGYTTQANFLLGCGLDELLAETVPATGHDHIAELQGVKQLTMPSEMGERFKVIALTRGIDEALRGFGMRDLSSRL